jgi:hypothetical protein
VLIDVVKMTSEGCFDVWGNMSRGLKRGRVEEIEWITENLAYIILMDTRDKTKL